MTDRLYNKDAYLQDFDAEVLSCEEGKKGYEIVLDRTAFFPEGGGQPADRGWLDGVEVLDVRDKKEYVLHICDKPLKAGSRVHGNVEWNRRFLHMQQHSGEHILSGIIHRLFGYDNIGFHMGKDFVTVDFSGLLTEEQIAKAEKEANEVVFANREIKAEYPSRQELASLEYRSKKEIEGDIRIVTVPGADVCACCGTHVHRTGEIGPIKVISDEHYKSGIRLTLEVGWKALEDYDMKHRNAKEISAMLSVPPEMIADGVEKQQEQIQALKNANIALKQKLFEKITEGIEEGSRKEILFQEDLNSVEVRRLADLICAKTEFAAVFSGCDEEGYKYVMCSNTMDVVALGKEFNKVLNGRGGGKNPMIQGSVQASQDEIRNFFTDKMG